MTKLYLRYQLERSFGVIASSASNAIYSNNGSTLIVPALHAVQIWDTRKGELESVLVEEATKGQVSALAIPCHSKDMDSQENILAVGYTDGSLRIWSLDTKECLITLQGHRTAVTCLNFDKTSHRLASGSKDTDIIIWDLVEQCGLYRLKGHKDQVTALRFLFKDGLDHLISSSKDTLIKIWDLKIQHCVETIMAHRGEVWALELFNNQDSFLSGAADGEVVMWSLNLDYLKNNIEDTSKNADDVQALGERRAASQIGIVDRLGKERIITIKMSPYGDHFGVQGTDRSVELFHILSAQEMKKKMSRKQKRLREKARKKQANEMENDEDQTIEDDGENLNDLMDIDNSNVVPLTTAEKIPRIAIVRCSARVRSFDFSSSKKIKSGLLGIMCTLNNNSIEQYLIDPSNIEEPTRLLSTLEVQGHRSDVRAVALSSTDELVVTGSNELVKVWNTTSGKCLKTFDSGSVLTIDFLPGNNYCIAGTRTGELQLFDITRSMMIESIQAHSGPIWGMQMKPDRKGFVTGSRDKEVKFWDLTLVDDEETGQPRPTLVHTKTLKMNDDVLSVRFSPDGKFIAVALLDSTVKILYVDTLKFFLSLYGHKLPVVSMDISSDNMIIATASSDKTIKIWGLDFGDCHKSIIAHQEGVTNCRFVWGTHYLFSTGKDKLVKYWDMDRHELIMKLDGHQSEVWALDVGKYGNIVVTGSHDKSIRIWKKTEDQFMLEEERERELEEQFEEQVVEDDRYENREIGELAEDADERMNDREQAEVGVAGRKTLETLKAGERLLEALEVYDEEIAQLNIFRQVKKQQPDAVPPARNPLIMAQVAMGGDAEMSSEEYVLRIIEGIKNSELEQALLLLPFNKVPILIKVIGAWAANGNSKSALAAKILVFLAKIFQHELVASRTTRTVLERTMLELSKQIGSEHNAFGFNLAALKMIQRGRAE